MWGTNVSWTEDEQLRHVSISCFYLFFWTVAAHVRGTFSFLPIQNDPRDERKDFRHLYFFHSELADFCLGMELCWGTVETKPGLPMSKWFPAVASLLISRNMLRLEKLSLGWGVCVCVGGISQTRVTDNKLGTTRSPQPWLVFFYIFSWLMDLHGWCVCHDRNWCFLNKVELNWIKYHCHPSALLESGDDVWPITTSLSMPPTQTWDRRDRITWRLKR